MGKPKTAKKATVTKKSVKTAPKSNIDECESEDDLDEDYDYGEESDEDDIDIDYEDEDDDVEDEHKETKQVKEKKQRGKKEATTEDCKKAFDKLADVIMDKFSEQIVMLKSGRTGKKYTVGYIHKGELKSSDPMTFSSFVNYCKNCASLIEFLQFKLFDETKTFE